MSLYYDSLKICCQKILPHEQTEYNKVSQNSKLLAAFFKKKLWRKNETITIGFLTNPDGIPRTSDFDETNSKLDPLQKIVDNMPIKEAIKKIVLERIQPIVNLKFVFLDEKEDSKTAKVRISFDPDGGSWSLVGIDCLNANKKEPTINFGWFDVPTVIHEFGHLCGLIHEHQNPFGEPIKWNVPLVLNWAKNTQGWNKETTYTNIINKYNKDELNGSDFDPKSIMLYFFPGILTLNNKGTNQNLRLSALDVMWLYKTYPINIEDLDDLSIPDNFYKKVYGKTLNEEITGVKESSWKKYLLFGVFLLFIIFAIWLIVR